jgi:micrococcal nuclease
MIKIVFLPLVIMFTAPIAEHGSSVLGPVGARVIEVIDGDTIRVRAHIWPNQNVETLVRIEGVNTPELKAPCQAERDLAIRARRFTEQRLGLDVQSKHPVVTLRDIRFDKFGGRVLARVSTPAGEDLGEQLLREGLAEPYTGSRRKSWCKPEPL